MHSIVWLFSQNWRIRLIDLIKLRDYTGKLDEDQVRAILDLFIASDPDAEKTWKVVEALQQGMEIIGGNFEIGKYCAGDLIFAGELLRTSIKKLKPLLRLTGRSNYRGLVLLGTVEGDVHDIGKNIFKTLAEISGFRVEDLGTDQKPSSFVDAIKKFHPQILGLSGVLTLAIASMERTIAAVSEAGLREGLKISIGGTAVNEDVCRYVGADAWSRNAIEAVKIFETWF
jgi:methanogenic corrinoid protein MtbC1